MQGRKSPIKIELEEEERKKLEHIIKSYKTPLGKAMRIKIVLMISEGHSLTHIGRELKVQRRIVRKWGKRYMEKGIKGLEDAPRSGRPPGFSP